MTEPQVQALINGTVSAVKAFPGQCAFNGGALTIDYQLDDTDRSAYNVLAGSDDFGEAFQHGRSLSW
jgi:hypothetical protein